MKTLPEKIKEILDKNQKCDCPCSGPFCNNFIHRHKKDCVNNIDYVESLLSAFREYVEEKAKSDGYVIPGTGVKCINKQSLLSGLTLSEGLSEKEITANYEQNGKF